jgi:hypothetical protein
MNPGRRPNPKPPSGGAPQGRSHSGNFKLHLDLEIAPGDVSAKVQLPNLISLAEDALKRRLT